MVSRLRCRTADPTGGYLIERLLSQNPDSSYNDVAPWNYSELPHAFGYEGWLTARVTTCGELDNALKAAEQSKTGAYIEVVTDKYAASALSERLHESTANALQHISWSIGGGVVGKPEQRKIVFTSERSALD